MAVAVAGLTLMPSWVFAAFTVVVEMPLFEAVAKAAAAFVIAWSRWDIVVAVLAAFTAAA
jgi:hypothetical protein